jgi:hypothetical protein
MFSFSEWKDCLGQYADTLFPCVVPIYLFLTPELHRRKSLSQTNHEKLKGIYAQYRADNNTFDTDDLCLVYKFVCDGRSEQLPSPCFAALGSVAINQDGNLWEAKGGNNIDGADEWIPIDTCRLDEIARIWTSILGRGGEWEGIMFASGGGMDVRFTNLFSGESDYYGGVYPGKHFQIYIEETLFPGRLEYDQNVGEYCMVLEENRTLRQTFLDESSVRISF